MAGRPSSRAKSSVGSARIAAPAGRDVAEPEGATVGFDRHRLDGLGAGEAARHPQVDAVRRGVDGARRRDGVLLGDAVEDLLRRDAERAGELGVAELNENLLRLVADEINLVDVGNAQQVLTNVFGACLELRKTESCPP